MKTTGRPPGTLADLLRRDGYQRLIFGARLLLYIHGSCLACTARRMTLHMFGR